MYKTYVRKWQPTPGFLPGIPWTEEPGRLQSMASQRVRHDRATEYTHTARMTLFVTGQHNAVVFKF